ncbi:MAG TPA: hypothetical protein VM689_22605 [Aliidongia sp.]|nr:hypothetical protein [Aliidongia sp.]
MRFLMSTLAVIAAGLATPLGAVAATISFTEDPAETAPIAVSTDLAGATIDTSLGRATVSIGSLTGQSTSLLDIALVQPGTASQTGGGKGVADILQLLSFISNGNVVGFEAIYLSDEGGQGLANPGFPGNPTFCSTMPVNEPVCAPGQPNSEFIKTGAPLSFDEALTLPGIDGLTDIAVTVQSPLQDLPVPEAPAWTLLAAGLAAIAAMASLSPRRTGRLVAEAVGQRG